MEDEEFLHFVLIRLYVDSCGNVLRLRMCLKDFASQAFHSSTSRSGFLSINDMAAAFAYFGSMQPSEFNVMELKSAKAPHIPDGKPRTWNSASNALSNLVWVASSSTLAAVSKGILGLSRVAGGSPTEDSV